MRLAIAVSILWSHSRRIRCSTLRSPDRWRQLWPGFQFVPAIEDAQDAAELQAFQGRADDAVRRHFDTLAGHEVYCCGGPPMVSAVRKACVEERGLDPHHFYSDVFVPGPAMPSP